jgi:hypothetical protein
MAKRVKLFCLVQGDDLNHSFRVWMEPTNSIADMKEKIKAKKHSFREADIDADALQLWKVSEWYLRMLGWKI